MQGEPLVMCRRHPVEDGIWWHRADRRCALCVALERVQQLERELRELRPCEGSGTTSTLDPD